MSFAGRTLSEQPRVSAMADLIYLKQDGTVFARLGSGPESNLANAPTRDGMVVGWSGSITDEDPARAAMRAWGGEGRTAVDTTIAARLDKDTGIELVIVPRAGDVVSDLPSAMSLSRRWEGMGGGRVKLLIDAELLMTDDMRRHSADHAERCVTAAILLGPTMVAAVCCDRELSARAEESGLCVVNIFHS